MSRSDFDKRKQRVRFRLRTAGAGRPRLTVFRSNRHIYAQLIDDRESRTVAAASTVESALRSTERRLTARPRDASARSSPSAR